MIKHIIITENQVIVDINTEIASILSSQDNIETEHISINLHDIRGDQTLYYDKVCEVIDENIVYTKINRFIIVSILTDAIPIESINPLGHKSHLSTFIGKMILTYPEVIWRVNNRLLNPIDYYNTEDELLNPSLETSIRLAKRKYEPLYDPYGLREAVINNMNSFGYTIKTRARKAIVVDDEPDYATINSYILYKYGNRTLRVNTDSMLKEIANQYKPIVSIEDLYLNFEDIDPHERESMSSLETRDGPQGMKFISGIKYRIIMTTLGTKDNSENLRYLEDNYNSNNSKAKNNIDKWAIVIQKPITGIHEIYEHTGLKKWQDTVYDKTNDHTGERERKRQTAGSKIELPNHSCPGGVLAVVLRIRNRIEQIERNCNSIQEIITGATLSTIAYELLNYRTPTLAFEMLSKIHFFETLAECKFYGVQAKFNIRKRLEEIKEETEKISSTSLQQEHSKLIEYNCRVEILERIRKIYQEQNQFDEEQECMKEIRQIYTRIRDEKSKNWKKERRSKYIAKTTGNTIKGVKIPGIVNRIMERPLNIIISAASLIALLIIFTITIKVFAYGTELNAAVIEATSYNAIVSFMGESVIDNQSTIDRYSIIIDKWFAVAAMILGYIHLGMLIAYMYQIINRK